jgi:hypothetical protein
MMDAAWRRLAVVSGLLLLLTYLLLQSRSPDLALRPRLYDALHAFVLYDAELTRDVLLARAGLLPHYDALVRSSRGLSQTLEILRQGSQSASAEAAKALGRHVEPLDAALRAKVTALEYFKADNALLRNSLIYILNSGQALRSGAEAVGQEAVAANVGALSHALLRFLQTPERTVGEEVEAIIDRLSPTLPFSQDLSLLVVHGRLIVDVLPQVDAQLRQLIDAPTTTHARALQEVALRHYGQVEARAQIYRWLLYLVAVMLLGYLVAVFARLRRHAHDLRQTNAD